MMDYWAKTVWVNASRRNHGVVRLNIYMGATGPELSMSIGDQSVVIATRWKNYTTVHTTEVIDAINEGIEFLRNLPSSKVG